MTLTQTLTQKETTLLQDLKSHEQLCIDKYATYAQDACDPNLKSLLTQLEQAERQHLNTINQILSGQVPQMGQSQSCQMGGNQSGQMGGGNNQSMQAGLNLQITKEGKEKDKYICSDLLSTEKHVSSVYNTCIFEFKDTNIRNALNHIQKEEQEHGEKLYKYMSQNGMYN